MADSESPEIQAGGGPDADAGEHDHDTTGSSSRKLAAVAAINLVGFVVELAGGLAFGSVALVSDAVHMLFDALAYVMAFAAAAVAERVDAGDEWTYGLHRIEPLAAFLNGLFLLPMVGYILWESYRRFLDPVAIGTGPTLAIAVGGLVVNVGSVLVLEGKEMSLNERGALYHLLGDAGGSVVVIVSVLAVEFTGVRAVDPGAALVVGGLVAWSAVRVLRESGAVFFLKTPVDTDGLRDALLAVEGVSGVTDLHAWQVCSQLTVATVHVEASVETLAAAEDVNARVHAVLADHGVDHATVECCSTYENRTHVAAHGH
ncbi:cation transporter [Halobacteriales archaeon QS_5_68_33]|nr:MAG: cation transporter [Halobacteriales archaeon QS_5_68_33]